MVTLITDTTNYVVRYCLAVEHIDPDLIARGLLAGVRAFRDRHSQCRRAVFVFDRSERSWRHELWEGWKADRELDPDKQEGIRATSQACADLLVDSGYEVFTSPGFDADDCCATIAAAEQADDHQCVIWSTDKDFRQLLKVNSLSLLTGLKRSKGRYHETWYTAADLHDEFGLEPEQWAEFRALCGDPSDGWPGAEWIGDKIAARLLVQYGTLERVMRMGSLLQLNKRAHAGLADLDWQLGLELMQLRIDAVVAQYRLEPGSV